MLHWHRALFIAKLPCSTLFLLRRTMKVTLERFKILNDPAQAIAFRHTSFSVLERIKGLREYSDQVGTPVLNGWLRPVDALPGRTTCVCLGGPDRLRRQKSTVATRAGETAGMDQHTERCARADYLKFHLKSAQKLSRKGIGSTWKLRRRPGLRGASGTCGSLLLARDMGVEGHEYSSISWSRLSSSVATRRLKAGWRGNVLATGRHAGLFRGKARSVHVGLVHCPAGGSREPLERAHSVTNLCGRESAGVRCEQSGC